MSKITSMCPDCSKPFELCLCDFWFDQRYAAAEFAMELKQKEEIKVCDE